MARSPIPPRPRNRVARANRAYGVGTAMIVGALALMSLTVWVFRPPTLDPDTLCPTDRAVAAHTLVIVDRTDRWNPNVGEVLVDLLEDARDDTQRMEKFSIVSLDSQMTTRPLFSVCNPGEPNFVSDIYRGRRYTEREFEQRFVGAAEEVIEQVRRPSEAQSSPIVEYVRRWLRRDDFDASVSNRHLILISDMRQNSDQLNVYATADREALAPLVEREFGEAGRDVNFDVYFVNHGHDYNVSENDIRDAWANAFQTINARYEWRRLD